MNNTSIFTADRMTHLKVVVVALIGATVVAGIGIAVRETAGTMPRKGTLRASTIAHAYPHRPLIGITLIPTPRRAIAGWLETLKEPFGTKRVYLVFNEGASSKRKIDTAAQADGVPASIAVSRGHLARGG